MASETSICAMALVILGDKPITNLADQTDRALLCRTLYADTRDEVLRLHPWNCCIKRVQLAPLADSPDFEWANAFQLPSDCLRVLSVGEDGQFYDYKLEGRTILADESVINLRYIYRNEDVSTYDALLIRVLTHAMASKMAFAVTRSNPQQAAQEELYRMALKQAKAIDGQEDVPDSSVDAPFIRIRGIQSNV